MSSIINARLDKREFEKVVQKMHERGENTKPMFSAIGNLAVKSVKQNFRDQGRQDKWKPSKKAKSGRTLVGTGALMKGIHFKVDTEGVTVMTTKLPYARILHFGGTTKPHEIKAKNKKALHFLGIFRKSVKHPGSNIPARPYMILQDEDIDTINQIVMGHFVDFSG